MLYFILICYPIAHTCMHMIWYASYHILPSPFVHLWFTHFNIIYLTYIYKMGKSFMNERSISTMYNCFSTCFSELRVVAVLNLERKVKGVLSLQLDWHLNELFPIKVIIISAWSCCYCFRLDLFRFKLINWIQIHSIVFSSLFRKETEKNWN